MSYWKRIFMNIGYYEHDGFAAALFKAMNDSAIKAMVSIALFLIVMGILVLLFPLVLAFFVALFFFTIAAIILYLSGRIWWQNYLMQRGPHNNGHFPGCA